jgi:predicted DNA-binding transcriptional regulator AlpA
MGDAPRPWPRLMRADTAAAYLDVSATFFRSTIAPAVPPITLGARVVAWRRDDLDRWLDSHAAPGAASAAPENPWHA